MRLLLICISVISLCMAFISVSNARIDLKTAAALWLFDEGKGKEVQDISGNENNGTFGGDPKWVKGKFGSAISFNGSADHIAVLDSESLDLPDAWSITAWAFVNKAESNYGHIVGKRSAATNYAFRVNQTGISWESYFWKGAWMGLWGQGVVKKDEWHYMTAVYDGKNIITIYEDAIQIGSGAVGGPPPVDDNQVRIAAGWVGDNSELLNGILDEVAIFNVALNVEQIEELMNEGIVKALQMVSVEPSGKLATCWGNAKTNY